MTNHNNGENTKIPVFLRIIAIWFAVFALGIAIFLIFFAGERQAPPEQAIYWFVVSLIAAVIPWIRVFKWGEMELCCKPSKAYSTSHSVKYRQGACVYLANLKNAVDENLSEGGRPRMDDHQALNSVFYVLYAALSAERLIPVFKGL